MDNERCYRIWDLPLRAFHWLLLAAVLTAIISANLGQMSLHLGAGQFILGLLVFRIVWGVLGTPTARFARFVPSPAGTLRYLRTRARTPHLYIGHNPLGAWSVLALLALLAVQVGTGLFADDDILTQGPLASLVSGDTRQFMTGLHKLNIGILLAFIGLHVLAIAAYRLVKKQDLVGPMIVGTACVPEALPVEGTPNEPVAAWRFFLAAGSGIAVALGVFMS
jgi:cytochrome b